MALPHNIYGTWGSGVNTRYYPAAGASTTQFREDLLDLVINLDKKKKAAIFLAMPKTTANGLIHEWMIDNLPATSTAAVEEAELWSNSLQAPVWRTRLSNVIQSQKRNFGVSLDELEYTLRGKAPGVTNEYEKTVQAHLLSLEQSIDAVIVRDGLNTTGVTAVSSAAMSAACRTLRGWVVTATSTTVGTASNLGSVISMGTNGGAWSRSKFLALHEAMFKLGSDPDTMAVSPGVKADITQDVLGESAAATGASAVSAMYGYNMQPRQIHTDGSATEYTADIQFMRTDFGRIAILVDRFIPETATVTGTNSLEGSGAFFLWERDKIRLAFWRPLRHYPLYADGDYMRGYVHCGYTIEVLHPNCLGVGCNVLT